MTTEFRVYQSQGISFDWQDFKNTSESGLATTSAVSLETLGCILSATCGLLCVQVPQMVSNLILYNGREFIPWVPAFKI